MKKFSQLLLSCFLIKLNNSFMVSTLPFVSNNIKNIHYSRQIINMKKNTPDIKPLSQYYKPKSSNQEQYVNLLNDDKTKILFAIGPAGTGKTLFACNTAIRELKNGNIDKIILTRPIVPVEEDLGFLPGNINKKMDPWTRPIFDIFLEFFSQRDLDSMVQNNIIEISPLAYMRGRTFKNAFIIADEMQNSSPNQMLMLTTRIGEKSRMIITGDLKQSDRGDNSGLLDFMEKFKLYEKQFKTKQESIEMYENDFKESDFNIGIKIVELTNSDIERSPVVSKILEIYETKPESSTFNTNITITNTTMNDDTSKKIRDYINKSHGFDDAALIPKNYFK